jgi:hypothetical protein
MSFHPALPNKFNRFLTWGLISLVVITIVWAAVITWWNVTQRVVSLDDALLYLIALPTLVLIVLGVIRLILKRKTPSSSQDSVAKAPLAASESDKHTATSESLIRLPVLAGWSITSAGANTEEFVNALVEKNIRPRPDNFLSCDRGFPLLTSRITELDTSPTQNILAQAIATPGLEHGTDLEEWRDAFLRALTLLANVLDQAQEEWPFLIDIMSDSSINEESAAATLRGTTPLPTSDNKRLNLHVKLIIPAGFTVDEQHLTRMYLTQRISSFPLAKTNFDIDVIAASNDTTAFKLADQFSTDFYSDSDAHALLLLACESALCPSVADTWAAAGCLFSEQRPNGLMMGEAAFATLFVNEKTLQFDTAKPICYLTRIAAAQRSASADMPGKPSSICLTEVVKDALTTAGIPGERLGTVVCDADHRGSRALECMGVMMSQTPQLDAIENRLALNEVCGHLGAASAPGILVAGIAQAKSTGHPVLLFNVSHGIDRAAAVLLH